MMKDYFKIESSKTTHQHRFQKKLNLFGDGGYQAVDDLLEKMTLDSEWMGLLPTYNNNWNIRRQELEYSMFLKR